jgi:hypothetical protein
MMHEKRTEGETRSLNLRAILRILAHRTLLVLGLRVMIGGISMVLDLLASQNA